MKRNNSRYLFLVDLVPGGVIRFQMVVYRGEEFGSKNQLKFYYYGGIEISLLTPHVERSGQRIFTLPYACVRLDSRGEGHSSTSVYIDQAGL